MASAEDRRTLPPEPLECRQNAEAILRDRAGLVACPDTAAAWALLAIAGELAVIRREMRKR